MIMWRTKRQVTALSIAMVVILGVVGWIVYKAAYTAPTCFDDLKNQTETGVDCGGSCIPCNLKNPKPINLIWARIVPIRNNVYDVAAEIINPNEVLDASVVNYEFTILDNVGVIARRTGHTFIFPQERMHVIETVLETTRKPTRIEFRILGANWKIAKGEEIPNILVERKKYIVVENWGRKKSTVETSILNKTPFNFKTLEMNVLLLGNTSNVIGVNKIIVENLDARSRKTVVSLWPEEVKGEVKQVIVEPRINTFDPHTVN